MKGRSGWLGQLAVRMTKSYDIIIAGRDGPLLSAPGPMAHDTL